jgi:hypothetical protein
MTAARGKGKRVTPEELVGAVAVCKTIQKVQRETTKPNTPERYALNRALHAVWALPPKPGKRGGR